ncbi:unnamed protein product [Prorocentrum cordatum]|uniref:Uncharacterized protein n=1 Tax=Prorocentrum cordatum TaxID=2364126 RepID=A0ABN9R8I6_9DINO|nr:unnamed protein product [Polarella glacialis]
MSGSAEVLAAIGSMKSELPTAIGAADARTDALEVQMQGLQVLSQYRKEHWEWRVQAFNGILPELIEFHKVRQAGFAFAKTIPAFHALCLSILSFAMHFAPGIPVEGKLFQAAVDRALAASPDFPHGAKIDPMMRMGRWMGEVPEDAATKVSKAVKFVTRKDLQADLGARLAALAAGGAGAAEASAAENAGGGRPPGGAAVLERPGTAMLPPPQPEPPSPPEEVHRFRSGDFSAEKLWERLSNGSAGDVCSSLTDAASVLELNGHGAGSPPDARRNIANGRASDNWNIINQGCSGVYDSQRELFLTLQRTHDLNQGSVLYMLSDFLGCRQQIGTFFDRLRRKTEDRPECGRRAAKLVDSPNFAMVVTGLIVLNAIWIAVACEDYMHRCLRVWDQSQDLWEAGGALTSDAKAEAATPEWMLVIDTIFAFLFGLELIARVTCGACPAYPAAAAAAPCPGCPSCPDCSLTCGSGPGWWAVLAALVAGLAAGGGLRVTLGWAARVASLFVGGTDPPPVTLLVEDDGAGQDGGAHRRFRAVRA